MSIFNKILEAHLREKRQLEQELAAKAAAELAATNEFIAALKLHIELVATPVFEEFARDAKTHGFPAKIEYVSDQSNNLIYTLTFAAVLSAELGAAPQSECACTINAMVAERKVAPAGREKADARVEGPPRDDLFA